MIACENSGHNVMDDFAEVSKIVEDGACGNFHILTDDDGIDSDTYKDCLRGFEPGGRIYSLLIFKRGL